MEKQRETKNDECETERWRKMNGSDYLPFGMETRVNYSIHVEVQIVELHPVWVGPRWINREKDAARSLPCFLLDDVGDGERVTVDEPPEEGGNAH